MDNDNDGCKRQRYSVLWDVVMSRCVSGAYASAARETADGCGHDRLAGGSQTKANRARLRHASISPAR
jgi:hypothetical protein